MITLQNAPKVVDGLSMRVPDPCLIFLLTQVMSAHRHVKRLRLFRSDVPEQPSSDKENESRTSVDDY